MPQPNAITVSIVSHGHLAMVREIVRQLDLYSHAVIDKLVLTFNIPEPGVDDEMLARFPILKIRNASAQGFGSNHNQAFRHCTSPWFLILNPDILMASDVLTPLLGAADACSGIVTPRVREPHKTKPEQHRRTITPLEIVLRNRAFYAPPDVPDWIPGMFMLVRGETFSQVHGFDEKFFMYAEDFDICARVKMGGWDLQVVEQIEVLHDARRASRAVGKHLFLHASSLFKLWTSRTFWKYLRFYANQKGDRP